jgi:2'-5' RNA ligase
MSPRLLQLIVGSLIVASCRHTEPSQELSAESSRALPLSEDILASSQENWKALSDYVAVNIPFQPVVELKRQLEITEGIELKGRSEAHITVITPQEMTVLRSRLSLEQINRQAERAELQNLSFDVQCLGRGELKQGQKMQATYFLVVQSEGLLAFREQLRQLYGAAGGDKGDLSVKSFYPHITVGFTQRDLHFADGVIKDKQSCIYDLIWKNS